MARRFHSLFLLALVLITVPLLAAEIPATQLAGKPKFDDGNALGYFIWIDGKTWKLRWTTFGAEHMFTGRVMLGGGTFTKFKRVDPDTERKVIAPGRAPMVVRGPRGRVVGVAGGRAPVVATREEDLIVQETETLIRWNTKTNDDVDGAEFELSKDVVAARFQLMIEGKPVPNQVQVGKENFRPGQMPLVVRIK